MSRTAVEVQSIAPPQAHYSHAIRAGNVVYIAGQVPIDPSGRLVQGDAAAQARQVLTNLKGVVEAAGATMDDVVKTSVFLTSRDDRTAVGKVRKEFFADPPPANTLVIVAGLADPEMLVEIEATVVLPS